jgi:hypothetical protein
MRILLRLIILLHIWVVHRRDVNIVLLLRVMIHRIRSVICLLVMLIWRSDVVVIALLPPRVVTIRHHIWGHLRVPRRLVVIHLVAVAV